MTQQKKGKSTEKYLQEIRYIVKKENTYQNMVGSTNSQDDKTIIQSTIIKYPPQYPNEN